MERGGGSPIALSILYLEVCSRVGLPMHAKILEGGRYAVLWPKDAPLQVAGKDVVIDVFSAGSLFLLDEVGTTEATHTSTDLAMQQRLSKKRSAATNGALGSERRVAPAGSTAI